jgi:hypothetical protein
MKMGKAAQKGGLSQNAVKQFEIVIDELAFSMPRYQIDSAKTDSQQDQ